LQILNEKSEKLLENGFQACVCIQRIIRVGEHPIYVDSAFTMFIAQRKQS